MNNQRAYHMRHFIIRQTEWMNNHDIWLLLAQLQLHIFLYFLGFIKFCSKWKKKTKKQSHSHTGITLTAESWRWKRPRPRKLTSVERVETVTYLCFHITFLWCFCVSHQILWHTGDRTRTNDSKRRYKQRWKSTGKWLKGR